MAVERVRPTPTHPVRLIQTALPPVHRSRPGPAGAVFEQVGRPTEGGVVWLWARTDLDLATAAQARRELAALVAAGHNPGTVLVYLGPERFVDLRGLRLLLAAVRWARSRGGDLAIVAPPRCLRRMVRLGRVDAELPLVSTARQAAWWARTRGRGCL